MSTDLVDRNGGGEGHSFEDGFFIIDFGEFFVDETVTPQTELKDFATNRDLFDKFAENI